MPRIAYIDHRFSERNLGLIATAREICETYARAGYSLTLRQLYYQFVARDVIRNSQQSYDHLGGVINNARLAGLIDWNHLEDRTRNLRDLSHWQEPADILDGAAMSYRTKRWELQPNYVEFWVEKDALIGVLERACTRNDVPYFSCRGYTSQSEVWGAAMRLMRESHNDERPVHVVHLGDHDPSGVDMTRDIEDRLKLFCSHHGYEPPEIHRIALNMDQVRYYNPPANPAKLTDSRAGGYIKAFGHESWELDALKPEVLDALIQETIEDFRDDEQWERDTAAMERDRERIQKVANDFRYPPEAA